MSEPLEPLSKEWQIEESRGEGLSTRMSELKGKQEILMLYLQELRDVYEVRPSEELAALVATTATRLKDTIIFHAQTMNAFIEHHKRMYGEGPGVEPIDLDNIDLDFLNE